VNPPFMTWQNFYVIVGSAAAALVGVQFVVIALIANTRTLATTESIRTFGTPTVVHLGGALLVSAIIVASGPRRGTTTTDDAARHARGATTGDDPTESGGGGGGSGRLSEGARPQP
jgi:hypothetical protein